MHRTLLLAVSLMTVFLAGCSDDPAPEAIDPDDEKFGELTVSDTTGAIRGLVLDPTVVPVAGVMVKIVGQDEEALTDEDGAFAFDDLPEGTYFLEASRIGYRTTQQSVDVEAGVERPDITKVVLIPDPESLPAASTQDWNGYLACGAGATYVSLNPCSDAGSDNVHAFFVEEVPEYVQVEMIWEGTNVLGDSLSIGIYNPNGIAEDFVGADCGSPCTFRVNGTTMQEYLGPEFTNFTVRVFPGTGSDGTSPSVVIEQSFTVYVTTFNRLEPDEDWLFVEDGPYEVPQ